MYALYLYNLVVHFITKAIYYLAHASGQKDFMYHPLLPLDSPTCLLLPLIIYIFFSLYIFSLQKPVNLYQGQ